MTANKWTPKVEVARIKDFEERGLAILEKHRNNFIDVGNKSLDYFFRHKFKDHVRQGKKGRHIFLPSPNPDAKVLAVAHLDTVVCPKKRGFSWNPVMDQHGLACVKMTTVDDRLGLAVVLFVLPEIGIECDILLTEGEESNNSTAQDFETTKQYNWLVEFDRAGSSLSKQASADSDVVTYMYKSDVWHEALTKAGMSGISHGTYTDICYLQFLKAKAMNMAIGYHDHHTTGAWFRVGEFMRGIELFKTFYDTNKDIHFEHTPVVPKAVTQWSGYDSTASDYGTQFIGYKTSRYQPGDVIMTSKTGRPDGKNKIGEIWANPRSNFWLVLDPDGSVCDVVSTNAHIDRHMKCANCNQMIIQLTHDSPRWGRHKDHAFCGDCWALAVVYNELVLDALCYNQPLSIDDVLVSVEALDEDGALCDMGGELVLIDLGSMERAVKYVPDHGHGRQVMVHDLFLDIGSVRYTYTILDTKGEDVYIRQSNQPDGPTWIVPARIMTEAKET